MTSLSDTATFLLDDSCAESGYTSHFAAYGNLVARLLPSVRGSAVFDAAGKACWYSAAGSNDLNLKRAVLAVLQSQHAEVYPLIAGQVGLLPLQQEGACVGVLALYFSGGGVGVPTMAEIGLLVEPVIALLVRELSTRKPAGNPEIPSGRTQELEWLFELASQVKSGSGEAAAVKQVLVAAVEHMDVEFAGLAVPEKRLELTHAVSGASGAAAQAYRQAHPHLMNYLQRQNKPLMLNKPSPGRAQGSECKMLAVPLNAQTGKVVGMLAFLKPVSSPDFGQREQFLANHLARQAGALLDSQFDLPTGLYTRAAFEQQVNQALINDPAAIHSLVYLDINGTHAVNETFGYDVGDEAIVRVAGLLATPNLPSDAMVARATGDRFVIFLPGCDADAAQACARALQKEVERLAFGEGRQRIRLLLNCGVAQIVSSEQAISRTIAAAELACKTAKERGGDRCEVYLDIDESMMRRRSDVSGLALLRHALDNDRLCVYAQKIASVNAIGDPRGMECLVRMLDDEGSIVSPQAFMQVAQRYRLLQEVDAWVIQNTLKQLAPYASHMLHAGWYASINISGQSLADAGFLAKVAEWVRHSRVPPGGLTFEITETAAVSNLERADELMRELRQMGCRFALDDFGTGVNSLAYLKNLSVQRVKIDGSFVRDIAANRRSEAMVSAVVQLASSLRIDCVAEYVADEAIYKKLRTLGVGYIQGYYIHQPEPLVDVLNAFSAAQLQRVCSVNPEL